MVNIEAGDSFEPPLRVGKPTQNPSTQFYTTRERKVVYFSKTLKVAPGEIKSAMAGHRLPLMQAAKTPRLRYSQIEGAALQLSRRSNVESGGIQGRLYFPALVFAHRARWAAAIRARASSDIVLLLRRGAFGPEPEVAPAPSGLNRPDSLRNLGLLP